MSSKRKKGITPFVPFRMLVGGCAEMKLVITVSSLELPFRMFLELPENGKYPTVKASSLPYPVSLWWR